MTIFANENPGGAWIGYLDCLGPPGFYFGFGQVANPSYLDYSGLEK